MASQLSSLLFGDESAQVKEEPELIPVAKFQSGENLYWETVRGGQHGQQGVERVLKSTDFRGLMVGTRWWMAGGGQAGCNYNDCDWDPDAKVHGYDDKGTCSYLKLIYPPEQ